MDASPQGVIGSTSVPQCHDAAAVSIAEDVERGHVKLQACADCDGRLDPGDGDGSQDVPVREDEDTTLGPLRSELEELVGPRVDLRRRLAARAAISEELPVRVRIMNLRRGEAFVPAVVDLPEQL